MNMDEVERVVIEPIPDDNGNIVGVKGYYLFHGFLYHFSLNQDGKVYLNYRGTISIWATVGRGVMRDGDGKPMSYSFYLTFDNSKHWDEIENIVKKAVIKRAQTIHKDNAPWLFSSLGKILTPDTITPAVAVNIKTDDFWIDYFEDHAPLEESRRKKYTADIIHFAESLPERPMKDYTEHLVLKILSQCDISKTSQLYIHAFWRYCVNSGICGGSNPVPKPVFGEATESGLQTFYLFHNQQDNLYTYALENYKNPMVLGLVLQLWDGKPSDVIPGLVWGNVIWETDPPFAKIIYIKERKAGAIKDFTHPMLPQCYIILKMHYYELLSSGTITKEELNKRPIVNIDGKAVRSSDIVSFNKAVLQARGIEEELAQWNPDKKTTNLSKKVFLNTYAHILNEKCGIDENSSTMAFMRGETVPDSTGGYYLSFTDHWGVQNIYRHLEQAQPEAPVSPIPPETLKDGRTKQTFLPNTTKERLHVFAEVILQPGEELEYYSPSGCDGQIKSRTIKKLPPSIINPPTKQEEPSEDNLTNKYGQTMISGFF